MMHTVTRELLETLRTPAGGFTRATVQALGVAWPLVSGWMDRLEGTPISDKQLRDAERASAAGPIHRFRGNTRGRR